MATAPKSLPLVNLSEYREGSAPSAAFLKNLDEAAHDIGFFYLTGHGVDPRLVQEVRDFSGRFFALPEADKLAAAMEKSAQFRGYTRAGKELTRGNPDWREQFDIGTDAGVRERRPGDPEWVHLIGPNLWPPALPGLKTVLTSYQQELDRVLRKLLRAFAVLLDQPTEAFDYLYGGSQNHLLKVIRYPGRSGTGDTDRQGVGPHKDGGLLTAVLQQDLGGLQVETDTGWIDAPPIPGTFVVNIGELLELASNGYLKATVHRVVSPPSGAERLSAAFFFGASFEAVVKPLALPSRLAALALGPDQDPLNPLFPSVGENSLKSRVRSHPDVARIHYPELVTG